MIGVIDILVLLSVTVGPTKAAALYVTMTAGAEPALKRAIAIRSVLIATIICVIFVLLGRAILRMLHISIPALLIAGGMVLFIFAVNLILGEDHPEGENAPKRAPTLDMAAYPLAVPLMASPQGLVAIVTIAVTATGPLDTMLLLGLVLAQMAFNLFFLLSADRIFARVPSSVLKVTLRILGLLLCGLAVQLAIFGLQVLKVIPGTPH